MEVHEKSKETLGERLMSIRKARKLSLRKLAAVADMEHSHINLIEKGKTSPSVSTLEVLADALEVPIELFFIDYSDASKTFNKFVINQMIMKRTSQRLTQEEVATYLNVKSRYIKDIEEGKIDNMLSLFHMVNLAKFLKCDLHDLLPK